MTELEDAKERNVDLGYLNIRDSRHERGKDEFLSLWPLERVIEFL